VRYPYAQGHVTCTSSSWRTLLDTTLS